MREHLGGTVAAVVAALAFRLARLPENATMWGRDSAPTARSGIIS